MIQSPGRKGEAGGRVERVDAAPIDVPRSRTLAVLLAFGALSFMAGRWTAPAVDARAAGDAPEPIASLAAADARGAGPLLRVQGGGRSGPRELVPLPGPEGDGGLLLECLLLEDGELYVVPGPGDGPSPGPGGPQELIPLEPWRPAPGSPRPLPQGPPAPPADPPGTLRAEADPPPAHDAALH